MTFDLRRRTRTHTLLVAALFAAIAVAALGLDLVQKRARYEALALSTARTFFRVTLVTRRWNAQQGGVYVPVTDRFQPNPYLDDPQRDLTATSGLHLTKVNPAYMTRLVAELAAQDSEVRIHITSLRPIRPNNAPDPWERAALGAFDRGQREASEITAGSGGRQFRYMASLVTEKPCLACHARQGYREGEVRGGISVSFPFAPYDAARRASSAVSVLTHGAILAAGLAFLGFLGRRLTSSLERLGETEIRVGALEGMLPICCVCKKIRREGAAPSDASGWVEVERYISDRTEAQFTHSYCPACLDDALRQADAGADRPSGSEPAT